MLRHCIVKGANLNERYGTSNWTALHLASECGYTDCVRLLLEFDATPLAASDSGETPLHSAARVAASVIQMGNTDITTNWDLGTRQEAILRMLLSSGANVNAIEDNGWSALHYVCDAGWNQTPNVLNSVDATIEKSNSCNGWSDANQPIVNKNSMELLESTFLDVAMDRLIRLFLEFGVNPNCQSRLGLSPIHLASRCGHVACLETLLQCGADPDSLDSVGRTPLFYAVYNGHTEAVHVLIEKGKANIWHLDHTKSTLLHVAAQRGSSHIAAFLIKTLLNYIDDGAKNSHTSTPSTLQQHILENNAPMKGRYNTVDENIVKRFLNMADVDGLTPLHDAAMSGSCSVVGDLVHAGASLLSLDHHGRTPLACCLLDAAPPLESKNVLDHHATVSGCNWNMARCLLKMASSSLTIPVLSHGLDHRGKLSILRGIDSLANWSPYKHFGTPAAFRMVIRWILLMLLRVRKARFNSASNSSDDAVTHVVAVVAAVWPIEVIKHQQGWWTFPE